ncbi:hypothetical protein DSO57_1035873 [Entomophthora muscae]|uniref:Uncharacterized protein n=1 Tax=Entomophthora muscae TaxID=34485 RepID=A0ACC2U8F5_9FUNG|nr:hypothetical protein DSO57_1035873 [Entomophthora muscae]
MVDREQKLLDAIRELNVSTCSQGRPKEPPQPDTQVAALTTQVAALQQEVAVLPATVKICTL